MRAMLIWVLRVAALLSVPAGALHVWFVVSSVRRGRLPDNRVTDTFYVAGLVLLLAWLVVGIGLSGMLDDEQNRQRYNASVLADVGAAHSFCVDRIHATRVVLDPVDGDWRAVLEAQHEYAAGVACVFAEAARLLPNANPDNGERGRHPYCRDDQIRAPGLLSQQLAVELQQWEAAAEHAAKRLASSRHPSNDPELSDGALTLNVLPVVPWYDSETLLTFRPLNAAYTLQTLTVEDFDRYCDHRANS